MVFRMDFWILITVCNVAFVLSTEECRYTHTLMDQEVYHIQNDEYPESYVGTRNCQWNVSSSPGTKISLKCNEFYLPDSTNCDADRLSVSVNGNLSHHCGHDTFSLLSQTNWMDVAFSSVDEGKFHCTMEVVRNVSKPRLAAATCDCGWRLSNTQTLNSRMPAKFTKPKLKIVGGYETGKHEFPAMAGLVDLAQQQLYCGATIIATYYVLTAAHCLKGKAASNLAVLVGGHNIDNLDDKAVIHRIYAYEIHPNFYDTDQNDIGIIRVLEPITFTLYVGPACLPFRYSGVRFNGQQSIAVGWGAVEFSGALSRVPREVYLPVISNSQCAVQQQSTVLNTQMCTYTQGKDTCQGDSGGPLFWPDPSTNRLITVGIVSSGEGCAGAKPGIYTYLPSFLSWIVNRTSDATYCVM